MPSNAERQKAYRARKKGKRAVMVTVLDQVGQPMGPSQPATRTNVNAAWVQVLEAEVAALKVAVALLKGMESRLRALEDRQKPEAYFPPPQPTKLTIAELRGAIQRPTMTGGAFVAAPAMDPPHAMNRSQPLAGDWEP